MSEDAQTSTEVRRRNPERTRADILSAATAEFASNGLEGARVEVIAARTKTTKRMIYYYFGSKEQLYLEVLQSAYKVIRELEQTADIAEREPVEALRGLAELTYDHHTSHQDFVRLVAAENVRNGVYIGRAESLAELNQTAIATLADVLARGIAAGVFRSDIDAVDLHAAISSYAFFHVANRYTFGVLFDRDLLDPTRQGHNRSIAGDLAVGLMTALPEAL